MGDALSAMGINGPFLISQIVNFLVMFGLITVLMWKPARKRLDERQAMLQKQVEDSEAAAAQLEQVGGERENVLVEAKKEAEKIVAQAYERVETIKSDASEEAKKIIQKAQVDAKEEETRLLKGVRDQVAALAMAATQKLLGDALDEKRGKALIDEFFSSVKGGKIVVFEGDDFQGKAAVVTSALPLTDKEKKVIEKDILQRAKGDLEISYEVDSGILGGLTIKLDDKLFDHSVSSQLAGLRARLS
ncbi:MAG: F0F1 ATP synthase subunit B [Anaerolineales bacterium]|nr:F0F1 ATP synthase subunit B [Anaerolineales bacterium]